MRLDEAVWRVKDTWEGQGGIITRGDYISLLLAQLVEAVQHAERGERMKYVNEMADVVSIAWQAIMSERYDPEPVVVRRILQSILPKMNNGDIEKKYRLHRETP